MLETRLPTRPAKPATLLRELGQQLRVDAVRAVAAAGSGHPTSALSAADLMAVLLANHLHHDFGRPQDRANDHLIFSKGHASPLLYAMYRAAEAIGDEELLTYRRLGSRLEGHPTPRLPWVDVATGSLGLGLPVGVGLALAGKSLEALPYRVWVLAGDSELAEGSMWEAFARAGARLTAAMLDRSGVVYLRTMRIDTPVIYDAEEDFAIGGSRVLQASRDDDVALLAAGITVHEALAASEELAREGVRARVVDLYSVKPLDGATVVEAARATGNVVVAEDHWAQGGLADAVLEVLADADADARVRRLAVTAMPTSGRPAELLRWAGIDRTAITRTARALVEETASPGRRAA